MAANDRTPAAPTWLCQNCKTTSAGNKCDGCGLSRPRLNPGYLTPAAPSASPNPEIRDASEGQLLASWDNALADLALAEKYEHNAHLVPKIRARLDAIKSERERRASSSESPAALSGPPRVGSTEWYQYEVDGLHEALALAAADVATARDLANRWTKAALDMSPPCTDAFDPDAPEAYAASRVRAMLAILDDREALRSQLAEAQRQRDELYAIINDDGSLTTHEEHLSFAREGVHYCKVVPKLDRENETLRSQVAEAQRVRDEALRRADVSTDLWRAAFHALCQATRVDDSQVSEMTRDGLYKIADIAIAAARLTGDAPLTQESK